MNLTAIAATAVGASLLAAVCLGGTALVAATNSLGACAPATASPSTTPTPRVPTPPSVTARASADQPTSICPSRSWIRPVDGSVVSGFRTTERPDHNGVDLAAARSTPVHAATAGTVLVARCDLATGDCDRDGSPTTPGCGWFVDIEHVGGVITRYCHLVARPLVAVGQRVDIGQVIGLSGTSGHSSGPHLHFEVHLHADRSPGGAVDPVAFMAARGAALR